MERKKTPRQGKDRFSWRHIFKIDLILAAVICLTLIAGVSGFFRSKDSVQNRFTVGNNKSVVEEEYGNYQSLKNGEKYTKKVCVKNTGKVPCYVRVLAKVTNPDTERALSIDYDQTNWISSGDYYYYKQAITPGASTTALFTTLTPKKDISDFKMICYEETVQSEGSNDPITAFDKVKGN